MNISNNFKTISKTLIAAVVLSVAMVSCSKNDDPGVPQPISGLNVIHATPATEKLDLFIGGGKANQEDFEYTDKIGYLSVFSGERQVNINKKGEQASILSEKFSFEPQEGYSLFVVDKFDDVKFLLLKDDLTAPASGKAKIRFVNLSPDAPALDLEIAGNETPLATNKLFKEYSDFETVDAAETVTFVVKDKETGVEETRIENVKIEANKIYTIWVKGLKVATDEGTEIGVAVFTH